MNRFHPEMAFLDACALYGEQKGVDVIFLHDESWYAVFRFTDANGPFRAELVYAAPKGKTKDFEAETAEQFEERTFRRCSDAIVKARKDRIMVRGANPQARRAA